MPAPETAVPVAPVVPPPTQSLSTAGTFSRQPEAMPDALAASPMFSQRADGQPVTRTRTCECGRRFTQRLLSERFLAIVEAKSANAMRLLQKQIPEFFVPVHCPRCERVDIGAAARAVEFNTPERNPERRRGPSDVNRSYSPEAAD